MPHSLTFRPEGCQIFSTVALGLGLRQVERTAHLCLLLFTLTGSTFTDRLHSKKCTEGRYICYLIDAQKWAKDDPRVVA